jgi:lysozyme family protein
MTSITMTMYYFVEGAELLWNTMTTSTVRTAVANVSTAIDYVINTWEDPGKTGVVTVNKRTGKRTRFGIDETWHPELTDTNFYTTMSNDLAIHVAQSVYRTFYAAPLCVASIYSQQVANKVLSLGINIGVHNASKLLQLAANVPFQPDGKIGDITLAMVNLKTQPQVLLANLTERAVEYYENVVKAKPEDQEFLEGWLRRARA